MIDGFRTYQYHNSLKLHFNSEKYDIFAKKGKTTANFNSYLKNKNYKLFELLGKYFESDIQAIQFMVANFAYGNTNFLYDVNDNCVNNYHNFLKNKESITNTLKEDLSKLELEVDKGSSKNVLEFTNGEVPLLFRMFMGGYINIESIFILNKYTGFLETCYPVFSKESLRIRKLSGFIKYDDVKVKTVLNQFKQSLNIAI